MRVDRPSCAAGDHAEPALQGQIPAAVRANGFNGYNCNLAQEGQVVSAARVGLATLKDDQGHSCAYFSSGLGPNSSTNAVDVTDPANPVVTATLTTPAMGADGMRQFVAEVVPALDAAKNAIELDGLR